MCCVVEISAGDGFCRNNAACYPVDDATNDVIDDADYEPSCSARA
jgi:hypothetical protein